MNIEKQIEFDKVKECWMNLAMTEHAKEKIANMSFYLSENEVKKELRDTTAGKHMIEKLGNPPLIGTSEITDILQAIEKDACLTPYQLERVEKVLVAIRRLKDYLNRGKLYDNPLSYYEENLDSLEDVQEEIGRQIRGGEVDDFASKELQKIREQITRCEERMKEKAEQIMRANRQYMADDYLTTRNGRICVPVKKENKLKISGSVIDKSATGSTVFMEPSAVAKYYEELQLCKVGEENEVYRILYTLTAMVAEATDILRENVRMVEKLDFTFSKGKLSMDMEASEPEINVEHRILLKDARHPLMDPKVNVPLQFEIGGDVQGIIITGPNTGGKTVAIKTVMLNSMMAQCGLHVTCKEADIAMNSSYLCDIGDGQSIEQNLSTFSAHITNTLQVLKDVNKDSLVIMDELGSGTDPVEGMGIAIAILEELRKSGCSFIVTTHYPEVKEYADKTAHIVNARMTFDKETLAPTYQMVIGEAGESCAFYIADRLGMPVEMLHTAIGAAYGDEMVSKYHFEDKDKNNVKSNLKVTGAASHSRIIRSKQSQATQSKSTNELREKYQIGDSVMIYPDRKLGIVCGKINEKGVLRVQLPEKKIWINHKRVKLQVAADELYPEDYDFSIIFDSVENRKIRHEMDRKYTDKIIEKYTLHN